MLDSCHEKPSTSITSARDTELVDRNINSSQANSRLSTPLKEEVARRFGLFETVVRGDGDAYARNVKSCLRSGGTEFLLSRSDSMESSSTCTCVEYDDASHRRSNKGVREYH